MKKKETKVNQVWIHPQHLRDLFFLIQVLEDIINQDDPFNTKYQSIRILIEKAKLPF